MRYVSGLEKVEVNDNVMTTGQDGIYPPGLNVGRVVDVKKRHGDDGPPDSDSTRRSARPFRGGGRASLSSSSTYCPPTDPAKC